MYYLRRFIAFSACSGSISLDMCIKKSFRKNKCIGGWGGGGGVGALNSLNKALFGSMPLA